jgi:GNAT superfamily N-acetyltransferase
VGEITAHFDAANHNVSDFDCGNSVMNVWLRDRAESGEGKYARTYVVCEGNAVVGYYCIFNGSVSYKELPGKMKRERGQPKDTPVMVIGRLAVDVRHQGTGLGGALLRDALKRIVSAHEIAGIRCILIHAIDNAAVAFYKRHTDFEEWPDGSRTLYMPMETAIAAVSASADVSTVK